MAAVASSQVAMAAVIGNATALNAVVTSSVAMAAVIGNATALNAVVTSSVAMAAIPEIADCAERDCRIEHGNRQQWQPVQQDSIRPTMLT